MGCSQAKITRQAFVTRSQWIMGTDIRLQIPAEKREHFNDIFEVFKEVDRKLSTYKPNSEVSQLNKKKHLQVSFLTQQMISLSLEMFQKTQGYFDPSLGQLTTQTYRFGRQNTQTPSANDIEAALQSVGAQNIILSPHGQVTLKNNIALDFGGIGKGYSVDLAIKKMKTLGIQQGQVAASGDIRCLSSCDIAIIDPFKPDEVMLTIKDLPADTAISTSGTYERFIKDQKNHHLLDPKTGRPSTSFVSLTLVGTLSNTELDAWATALSTMPSSQALTMAQRSPGFAALFVRPDKTVVYTPSFEKWLKKAVWFKNFKRTSVGKNP